MRIDAEELTFADALLRFRALPHEMALEEHQERLDAAAEKAFAARQSREASA